MLSLKSLNKLQVQGLSVQPKNVRLEVLELVALFLPHKNTEILLEHHRGTITKSGLPLFPLQLKCMEWL